MITATRECTAYSTRIVFRHPSCVHSLAEVYVSRSLSGKAYRIEVAQGSISPAGPTLHRLRAAAVLLATIEADEIQDALTAQGHTVEALL